MAHLLIADDIAISRETLARVLRDAGHRVTQVASGQEAVERARADRPDLVILDLNMPKMTGLQAAPMIKGDQLDAFLPVFIVSGRSLSGAEIAEVLQVADDFIRKPYTPAELCARIDVGLRTRRLFEERRSGGGRPKTPAPVERQPQTNASSGQQRQPPRTAIMERLNDEWRRATRWNEPFSLLLCDVIDPASAGGDGREDPSALECWLPRISEIMQQLLRQAQVLGASGSLKLAILLPATPPAAALEAAEQLRARLKALQEEGACPHPLPLVLGLALFPGRDIGSAEDLHHCARVALQRASMEGPFSLCVYQHQGYLLRDA